MPRYEFRKSLIADDIEEVGLDVRPVLEVKAERAKLSDYGDWLSDKWPVLFEKTVRGPSSFVVTKNFVFPGVGEAEVSTLTLTPRGPVFSFPRKFATLAGQETELPEARDVVIEGVKGFLSRWPRQIVRVGAVRTYVFDAGGYSAREILAGRFVKFPIPEDGELRLRLNRPAGGYNRVIEVEAVAKYSLDGEGSRTRTGEGIRVKADCNNRDMSEHLEPDRIIVHLHTAEEFTTREIYEFLNREED